MPSKDLPLYEKFFDFKTFEDPTLIGMMHGCIAFFDDMEEGHPPRWLSYLGTSGVGKTHLAKRMVGPMKAKLRKRAREFQPIEVEFHHWTDVADKLRHGEYGWVDHLIGLDGLVLDEIGAEAKTEFVLEKLFRVLNGRLDKWTVLTGNITRLGLAELDPRMASRLGRGNNVIINADTTDYDLR